MRKIRILNNGENSNSNTGFGLYSRELFKRLDPDIFELAELSAFLTVEDENPSWRTWYTYPAAVKDNDERYREYSLNSANKSGLWRFDRVLLDFKPDIVLDVRDPWNLDFEAVSPLRPFYHWVISPTIDSYPQQDDWINTFKQADGLFTYSHFGKETLERQCPDIKVEQPIYCGVDLDIFKPQDKEQIRKKYNIPSDAIVLGTVMRNQRRKLFPELFEMFAKLLQEYKGTHIYDRLFLYCHTSYPDVGYDIPTLIRDLGIGHKVLFTYFCRNTKQSSCSLFEGPISYSVFSNSMSNTLPNASIGVTSEQLSEIYNCFDLYVQYSSNEGLGIPMLEAAACGVPLAGINYSAMDDNIRLTKGIRLSHTLRYESTTQAYRATPNIEDNVKSLMSFIDSSHKNKEIKSKLARQTAEKHFNWDINAKVWSDYFQSVQLKGLQGKWDAPARQIKNIPEINNELSDLDYITWLYKEVSQSYDNLYTYNMSNDIMGLNRKLKIANNAPQTINREKLYKYHKRIGTNLINQEYARLNINNLEQEDYIQFAHLNKV